MYVEIRAWGSLTVVEAATMQQPRSLEMRGSKQSFSGILPSRSEPNAQLKSIPRYSIFSISLSVSLTQIKIRGISISRERNQLQYIVSKSSFNVFILYYYNLNPTRCSLNIDPRAYQTGNYCVFPEYHKYVLFPFRRRMGLIN